ncbi:AAA family ATPase [Marinihelvus fidelis]|uniref:AAA family ATPase n=1 Tax=Marinihelvus fidelis TaxID=2613842 RepID=A0A5N0TDB3_9GAMM|nr:ExeA family protein [Marinihelvus fidelis]KAA9131846.1 AAA family ATPase [Marinihelvus fidelis]
MYLKYFGLAETPFSITPDPTFIYLSRRHREAFAHLLYGVGQGGSGGFVQLTGEVGTGKTTLCRALLEQVSEDTHVALVLNPLMNPVEMLEAICEELAIDIDGARGSAKSLVDRLNVFLLDVHERGGRTVVVIDEAQNLSPESLEQVRLLTNLETRKDKLLQIILLGQPELRELLQRRDLRQLAQRITARYHLAPLDREETGHYVAHRLEVAGANRNLFSRAGLNALYQRSGGVPRLINIIADRALAGAYARERERGDARLVHAAADEVQLGEPGVHRSRWPWLAAAAVLVGIALAVSWQATRQGTPPGPSVATVEPVTMPDTQAPEPALPAQENITAGDAQAAPRAVTEITDEWLLAASAAAWPSLATAWGRPADAALVQASCRGQEGLGYACVREQGTWSRILQIGLPVIIELEGNAATPVMLAGIDGDTLLTGSGERISRQALESRWFGSFLVAWPQASAWPRQVSAGDSGPVVDRLMAMAALADTPYRGAPGFGPEFEAWLRDFQRRHGLDVDGIVGPRTLLYLMRFSIEQPRLDTGFVSGA